MLLKKAYYYFYYKMYKLINYTSEKSGGKFLTDFKTTLAIIALELWLVASLLNYYNIFIDSSLDFSKVTYVVIAVVIALFNYLIFTNNVSWKKFNNQFEELPATVNKKGSFIFFGIVLFIICNFIFSIYLLYLENRG
ncbi:hypothetical protein PQ462_09830 [Flavobacterium sp. KACC 22758]|jgi:ABC-type uncharacterized transport system YnjBCD permease subunit|uniref:hypothetical protein n=1 Tax=Flavobacterium sp. KACC 22758 TaxID=3025667 RepID=UPI0023670824|nr:hypothetical protein [Flavobacterium sp. KACC 22758]WDF61670.1 hypothetical protein PQ462_09830 [Flavobacterium sp. KACC 22758]